MNVAIVTQVFPILSESFILRMIESLHRCGVGICVYATESADLELLRRLAPELYDLVGAGTVEVIYSKTGSRATSVAAKASTALLTLFSAPLFALRQLLSGVGFRQVVQAISFRRLSRGRSHDVVHAQFLPMGVAIVTGMSRDVRRKTKLISYVRGYDISRPDAVSDKEMRLLASFDGLSSITCVSQSLASLAEGRGFPRERIEVIHSGIPISNLEFKAPSLRELRPIKFVQVGRLVEKKGYDLTLRMLRSLDDEHCTLEIVGQGELERDLKALVQELGLQGRVHFRGALDHRETISAMLNANVMLVPSRTGTDGDSEGIPNVAKEAMALGVICVGSDHSGIPEIIREGETGFTFCEGNLEDFVSAVERALSSKEKWDEIARSARNLVELEYDSMNTAGKLIEHYSRDFI